MAEFAKPPGTKAAATPNLNATAPTSQRSPSSPAARGVSSTLALSQSNTGAAALAEQRAQAVPGHVAQVNALVSTGKVDQAVKLIQRLDGQSRNLVVGLSSTDPAIWPTLRRALILARVHSPTIDLCLAGPTPPNPLTNTQVQDTNAALAAFGQFRTRPLPDKMREALTYMNVGPELKKQVLAIFSPPALAAAAVIFGALQFTPAGWVTDAAVVVISAAAYGTAAFQVGTHLKRFVEICQRAGTKEQLQLAGEEATIIVAILGVNALGAVVSKAVAAKAKAKTSDKDATPAEKEAGQTEKDAGQAAAEPRSKDLPPVGSPMGTLGDDELLYGRYTGWRDASGKSTSGVLAAVRDEHGGMMLSDALAKYGKKLDDFDRDWTAASLWMLEKQAAMGKRIHFDLTYVGKIKDAYKNFPNSITVKELKFIQQNWDSFKDLVIFYKDGKVVDVEW